VSASLDLAAPKLGSGARFKKLSATLAARGASNPDALAAYIGRKRYGNAGMGRLSAGHKQLANPDLGIYLSETEKDDQGQTLVCPECGHIAPSGDFGASGTSVSAKPGVLRTPAPSTGGVRQGVPLTVRGGAAHALANDARSSGPAISAYRAAVELATGTLRRPIHGPMDVLVKRAEDGSALLKHRNGGATIASLRRNDAGKWVASVNGKDGEPRDHQRTALMEAVGTWNSAVRGAVRPQSGPLQPEPQQSALMAEYGIPAMRSAAFATPTAGASDGPRMTTASAGGGTDDNGLSPKAQAVYKKLLAKGFPQARALAFAKNSERFGKAA
jgi:hypothetical protein